MENDKNFIECLNKQMEYIERNKLKEKEDMMIYSKKVI